MSSPLDPTTTPKPMLPQEQIERFLNAILPAFHESTADGESEERHARHVAILHELYQAVGRSDLDAIADGFHEEALLEIEGPPSVPFVGAWAGRSEVVDAVRRNFGMLEGQEPEIQSLAAQGDHVVVILRERGRYIASALEYCVRCAQVFTFEDGKVRRLREIVVEDPNAFS